MQKHTLYVGLFDKDTKAQRFTTLEAYKVAETVVLNYAGGATISEACGIYKHDDGTVVTEPSLRIELAGLDAVTIKTIIDGLKLSLNQESVMVEVSQSAVSFE